MQARSSDLRTPHDSRLVVSETKGWQLERESPGVAIRENLCPHMGGTHDIDDIMA